MSSVKNPIGDNNQNPQAKVATNGLKLIGETLGNFRLTDELGKGGMGVVYKAYDRALDRVVAIKVLLPHLAEDEGFIKRFIREARISAKLEHPNIVQIHAANKSGALWYIAMQYIRGKTLADYLKEKSRFSIRDALVITRSVAMALACAHRIGIIHRDIKPSNIMIDENGQVKVMDFGLARARAAQNKITQTGLYLGTPEYSSPEQCESSAIDERADIYSLGVILYELLAGRVPHVAETPLSLFKKIVEEEPVPLKMLNPNIPNSVVNLVNKMMVKEKENRCPSTKDVVNQIDRILRTESLPLMAVASPVRIKESIESIATPVTPLKRYAERIKAFKRQYLSPAIYAIFGTAAVLLIALIVILINRQNTEEEKPQPVPAPVVVKPREQINTIVFDFQNLRSQPELKWLEIAVPEMLIVNLNQCNVLKTIPRSALLETMKQVSGKRISFISDELNKETISLLNELESDVVISGKIFVPEPPQIRIMVHISRYTGGKLQHIADCQIDGVDYTKDLLKIIDKLTVHITDALRQKGPAYTLSGAERIAMAKEPDIAGLMIAQLKQANQMALYLTEPQRQEAQKDKSTDDKIVLRRSLTPSPAAPASVSNAFELGKNKELRTKGKPESNSAVSGDARGGTGGGAKDKYSLAEGLVGQSLKEQAEAKPQGIGKPEEIKKTEQDEKDNSSKEDKVKIGGKGKNHDVLPSEKMTDKDLDLINQLQQMYEGIQKIEDGK